MKKLLLLYCYLCCTALMGQELPAAADIDLTVLQSIHDEAHPVIATDGKTLYFSRKGHPQNVGDDDHYDIWIAFRKNNGNWGKAVHMPLPINNRADNFVVSPDADGLGLYLFDGSQEPGEELVYTKKQGRSWPNPKPVQIENFDPTSPIHFSMADDNQILILSVKGDDGYGGRDIFVSEKRTETLWSEPINLGNNINTNSEEYYAYLAADNKTLYFLRKDTNNPEMMTLMVSHRNPSDWVDWSAPTATKINLNATSFDKPFCISARGNTLYIVGKHNIDSDQQLFAFDIPEEHKPEQVALVQGVLIDAETGFELDGNVLLESLASFTESQHQQTNRGGRFQFVLPDQSSFNLSAQVPGYFAKSEIIAKESLQELDQEIENAEDSDDIPSSPEVDELNVRLQKLNKAMQELERRRLATQMEMEKRKRINWSPAKADEQLAGIEARYREALGIAKRVDEVVVSSGDDELDAMKRAFLKHNNVRQNVSQSNEKTTLTQTQHKEETELEAMKRKYREANNPSIEETDANQEETPKVHENVVLSAVELEHNSFSDLVMQSKNDLEEELSERVIKELRADLLQEVSFKMHADMDMESREQYAARLQRKTEMLESEVRKELRKKYRSQVKRELRGELLEVVEEELRTLLREEVKRELREELEDEVREELRLELEYLLTQEMATDIQKELRSLLKQLRKNAVASPGKYYGGAVSTDIQKKNINKSQKEIKLALYPLRKGTIIPLENIFFEANSTNWKDSALPELNRIYDLLNNNPTLKIEIGGHCNGWSSTSFANNLSTERAKAVANYLLERGIAQERLSWVGYGKTQPLVPNDSVENCKKNQRLEMKVL